jgi:hypothetical protein
VACAMLNAPYAMLRFMRLSLVVASACLIGLSTTFTSSVSLAQSAATTTATAMTTTGAPSITISPDQLQPERFVGNVDRGQSTRPVQLTPNGISYTDCTSDMVLKFPMVISNFNGTQLLEVWAGTADCSMQANRGYAAIPSCWEVTAPISGLIASGTTVATTVSIRVQDLVGHVNSVPSTMTYDPVGVAACSTQTVDTAESINLVFVPTSSTGQDLGGVSYTWPADVDMVGPGAPATPTQSGAGDTLLVASWTPNIDPDTIGYDIYIDPIPGQEPVGSEPVLVCSEAAAPSSTQTSADASDGASADATSDDATSDGASGDDGATADATMADATTDGATSDDGSADANISDAAPTPDAECVLEIRGAGHSTGSGGIGESSVLSNGSSLVLDGSAAAATPTTTTTTTTDDANILGDDATTVLADDAAAGSTGGGISKIDPRYLYKPDSNTGITIPSQTASSYTITGLVDGQQYNIAIAAVDALGNVGPLSNLQCGTPKLVNDFWKTYLTDNGKAGGGFCALEAAGAPAGSAVFLGGFVAIAAAAWRRRRRNQR